MKLRVETTLDPTLLDLNATQLLGPLDGPTLFDLSSSNAPPAFISVLLHGNETSGWDGIRSVLSKRIQQGVALPSLLLLVGNVAAAAQGARYLDDQVDFNRIWDGGEGEQIQWADKVFDYVKQRQPHFAADMHNNSGPNPPFSIIANTYAETLEAARAYGPLSILARQPHGNLTRRFSQICTSISCELGMASDLQSAHRAESYINAIFNGFESNEDTEQEFKLHRNDVRVIVDHNGGRASPLDVPVLDPVLDKFNFEWVGSGTVLAKLESHHRALRAVDADHRDVSNEYLHHDYRRGDIRLARDVVISMYTRDPLLALQDCVCYFLEPVDMDALRNTNASTGTKA